MRGSRCQLAGRAAVSQKRANAPAARPGGERGDGGAPAEVGPKKFPMQLHKEALGEGCEGNRPRVRGADGCVAPRGWRWPRRPATASGDAPVCQMKS